MILDIKYKNGGLSSQLSNLYPYEFVFDGYKFASMEAFLQSLKIPNIEKEFIFDKFGYEAWSVGNKYDWYIKQELYWIIDPIDRHSKEYEILLNRAYDALFEQNIEFKSAIENSLSYKLTHNIGGTDPYQTIMTRKEFIFQLNKLQKKLGKKFFDLNLIFKI